MCLENSLELILFIVIFNIVFETFSCHQFPIHNQKFLLNKKFSNNNKKKKNPYFVPIYFDERGKK